MKSAERRVATVKRRERLGWLVVGILTLLGVFVRVALPGYHFSGYVILGAAAVAACILLLRIMAKRRPKPARILLTVLLCMLGIGLIAAAITGAVLVKAGAGQIVPCDYVVVLGAGVNGTVPSLSLRERLDAAYDYLTEYPESICVVSGGQGSGEDISEAQCMFQDLTARGIDKNRVWMEDKATDTRENIRFSLDLIEEITGNRPTQIGLVYSEYHLYRANLFAREENIISYGIPARTSWVTLRINYYLREIAAVWYYQLLGG